MTHTNTEAVSDDALQAMLTHLESKSPSAPQVILPPVLRSIITELLSRRAANSAGRVEVKELDVCDEADDEAVEWVTKNLHARRHDSGKMEYTLVSVVRAYQAGKAAAEEVETKWRNLALQFDGHRIEALSHIRGLVHAMTTFQASSLITARKQAESFLAAPPLSGEKVLAARLSSPAVEAEPVATASLPEHAKWCQPGDRQDKRHFLVRFDDPDCRDSVFTDEDEARKFYARATLSWNCWLFGALPAHPSSPVSAEVTEQQIDKLAEHLCSEFDEDFLPAYKAHWPEDANDDGKREGGFVAIQPKHVQSHARDQAKRILTFIAALNGKV